ncbi:MAG: hypothetical protein V3S33_03510 [Gammaproteobacteria bacterium]
MRHYVAQRSREWFGLRIGKVTSTRLKTIAHGTLAAQSKLLDAMEWEVENSEEAIDTAMEGFGYKTPSSIALGREREQWLIARYEIKVQQLTGQKPKLDFPGFVTHDHIPELGCSPDWLNLSGKSCVGEGKTRVDRLKHEFAMKRGLLPEDKDQVYCHMMCCGIPRADYVSYCPEFPAETSLCIVTIEQDVIYSNFLYAELNRFIKHFRAGTRPTVPQVESGVPSFFD